jgi:hypothetical protein
MVVPNIPKIPLPKIPPLPPDADPELDPNRFDLFPIYYLVNQNLVNQTFLRRIYSQPIFSINSHRKNIKYLPKRSPAYKPHLRASAQKPSYRRGNPTKLAPKPKPKP